MHTYIFIDIARFMKMKPVLFEFGNCILCQSNMLRSSAGEGVHGFYAVYISF